MTHEHVATNISLHCRIRSLLISVSWKTSSSFQMFPGVAGSTWASGPTGLLQNNCALLFPTKQLIQMWLWWENCFYVFISLVAVFHVHGHALDIIFMSALYDLFPWCKQHMLRNVGSKFPLMLLNHLYKLAQFTARHYPVILFKYSNS